MESCRTCKFFFNPNKGLESGLCRYNPPTVFLDKQQVPGTTMVQSTSVTLFPGINKEGWCGKYEVSLDRV